MYVCMYVYIYIYIYIYTYIYIRICKYLPVLLSSVDDPVPATGIEATDFPGGGSPASALDTLHVCQSRASLATHV
jgi:hypothetical protein